MKTRPALGRISLSIGMSKYFRLLELSLVVVGAAYTAVVVDGLQGNGTVAAIGTSVGPIATMIIVLELCALFCEWKLPTRRFSGTTTVITAVWLVSWTIFVIYGSLEYAKGLRESIRTGVNALQYMFQFFDLGYEEYLVLTVKGAIIWFLPLMVIASIFRAARTGFDQASRSSLILAQVLSAEFFAWNVLLSSYRTEGASLRMLWWVEHVLTRWDFGSEELSIGFGLLLLLFLLVGIGLGLIEVVHAFGTRETWIAAMVSSCTSTAVILIPQITRTTEVSARINSYGLSDYYHKYWELVGHRVWVALFLLLGGTILIAALLWLRRSRIHGPDASPSEESGA